MTYGRFGRSGWLNKIMWKYLDFEVIDPAGGTMICCTICASTRMNYQDKPRWCDLHKFVRIMDQNSLCHGQYVPMCPVANNGSSDQLTTQITGMTWRLTGSEFTIFFFWFLEIKIKKKIYYSETSIVCPRLIRHPLSTSHFSRTQFDTYMNFTHLIRHLNSMSKKFSAWEWCTIEVSLYHKMWVNLDSGLKPGTWLKLLSLMIYGRHPMTVVRPC